MAKIEMDISEYEIMKENKKLLENSLEKERELQSQIKILCDEKTKALEEAKMKVVKITKSEVTEHALVNVDQNVFDDFIKQILSHIHNGGYRRGKDTNLTFNVGDFIKKVFTIKTTKSPQIEQITTHGLDDIKLELRSEIEKDIKEKLDNAEIALCEYDKILKRNREVESELYQLQKFYDDISRKNEELIKDNEELSNKLSETQISHDILNDVRNELKYGYGFFNKSLILDNIIKLIKNND